MLGRLIGGLLGRGPAPAPQVSFIICSIDDARFAAVSANIGQCMGGISHEVVRSRNARSLTAAYNKALGQSRGELVVFCHDDIEILQPDFGQRLLADLAEYDVLGVAGTSLMVDGYWGTAGQPHLYGQVLQKNQDKAGYTLYMFDFHDRPMPSIQALDGLFIAAHRSAAEQIGFDSGSFDGFHLYDADFAFRAHRAGLKVGVSRSLLLFHQSHGDKGEAWEGYMRRFQEKFADVLPAGFEPGPQYALTVQLEDKAAALPAFLDIRGNPQRYME